MKMSVNSRLKSIQIIDQIKAFYRQRIPEFSCARKETVDIDILIKSRNGDKMVKNHTIYQNIEQTSNRNKEVQMNIYQSNTYSKDVSCLHFGNDSCVQEMQEVRNRQSYISVFVIYLTFPSSSQEHQPRHHNSINTRSYGRYIQIKSNLRRKKLHRMNQGSNFRGGSFNNRDYVRATI